MAEFWVDMRWDGASMAEDQNAPRQASQSGAVVCGLKTETSCQLSPQAKPRLSPEVAKRRMAHPSSDMDRARAPLRVPPCLISSNV